MLPSFVILRIILILLLVGILLLSLLPLGLCRPVKLIGRHATTRPHMLRISRLRLTEVEELFGGGGLILRESLMILLLILISNGSTHSHRQNLRFIIRSVGLYLLILNCLSIQLIILEAAKLGLICNTNLLLTILVVLVNI